MAIINMYIFRSFSVKDSFDHQERLETVVHQSGKLIANSFWSRQSCYFVYINESAEIYVYFRWNDWTLKWVTFFLHLTCVDVTAYIYSFCILTEIGDSFVLFKAA